MTGRVAFFFNRMSPKRRAAFFPDETGFEPLKKIDLKLRNQVTGRAAFDTSMKKLENWAVRL